MKFDPIVRLRIFNSQRSLPNRKSSVLAVLTREVFFYIVRCYLSNNRTKMSSVCMNGQMNPTNHLNQVIDQICFRNRTDSSLSTVILSFLAAACCGYERFSVLFDGDCRTYKVMDDYICFCKMKCVTLSLSSPCYECLLFIPLLCLGPNVNQRKAEKLGRSLRVQSTGYQICSMVSWSLRLRNQEEKFVALDLCSELLILNLSTQELAISIQIESSASPRFTSTSILWFKFMHAVSDPLGTGSAWLFFFMTPNEKMKSQTFSVLDVAKCLRARPDVLPLNTFVLNELGVFRPCTYSGTLWIWNNNRLLSLPLTIFTPFQATNATTIIKENPTEHFVGSSSTSFLPSSDGLAVLLSFHEYLYFIQPSGDVYCKKGNIFLKWKQRLPRIAPGTRFHILQRGQMLVSCYEDAPKIRVTVFD